MIMPGPMPVTTHTENNVRRNRTLVEEVNGEVQTGRAVYFWMFDRKTDVIYWDGYIQWEPDSSTLIEGYVEIEEYEEFRP